MKVRPIRIVGDVAYITLTQGYEAVIDTDDAHLVLGFNWFARVSKRRDGTTLAIYAVRNARIANDKKRIVPLHRVLLSAPDSMEVDHIDSDGLNNRRSNLRLATISQNRQNARTRTDNTSGVKGVFWDRTYGKWAARIKWDGKTRHLGRFDSIKDAAAAYAKASVDLHGQFGRTA